MEEVGQVGAEEPRHQVGIGGHFTACYLWSGFACPIKGLLGCGQDDHERCRFEEAAGYFDGFSGGGRQGGEGRKVSVCKRSYCKVVKGSLASGFNSKA